MRHAAILLCLALLAGCSEESDVQDARIRGQVTRVEDGRGYGPVLVALYELRDFRVETLVETDAEGRFLIEPLKPGEYTPVVYDRRRVLWELRRPAYQVRAYEETYIELPMAPTDAYPNSGLYIDGKVVDADTQEPIPHAAVEMVAAGSGPELELFSEFVGRSGPLSQLTNHDGEYRIGPIIAVAFPDGSVTIPHLRVSHPLYGDAVRGPWDGDRKPEYLPIGLTRGVDPGVIRGELRSFPEDEPLAGVAVGIEWLAGRETGFKLIPPGLLSYTDQQGLFELSGVAYGRYDIRGGLQRDDGWIPILRNEELWPDDGDTLWLDEPLVVTRAVELLEPAENAKPTDIPTFRWRSHTLAVRYGLLLDRAVDAETFAVSTVDTFWVPTPAGEEFLGAGGRYVWNVYALDAFSNDVSLGERPRGLDLPSP